MKIKSFECPKSIKNYEKKNTWNVRRLVASCLSHRPSEPAYYIVDCRIFKLGRWQTIKIGAKIHLLTLYIGLIKSAEKMLAPWR